MLRKWARRFEKCINCGTIRFRHKAKGLCTRCYGLARKLEQVERWNLSEPESLNGFPTVGPLLSPELFRRIKSGFESEYRGRLYYLKLSEEQLDGAVDGLTLEGLFVFVARQCRVRDKHMFKGTASYLQDVFDVEQRKILFRLLNDIYLGVSRKVNLTRILFSNPVD